MNTKYQFGQEFIFLINDPYNKNKLQIDAVYYLFSNSGEWIKAVNTRICRITRLDTINENTPDFRIYDVVSVIF
jgi:hypothetical protein